MKPNSNQQGSHQSHDHSYPTMGGEYTAGQHFYPQQQHYPSGGPPMMFPQQNHGMPTGTSSFHQPSPSPQQQQQYHFPQQPSGQLPATAPSYGAGQYFIDAACTVPAGQLAQQPQLLHQMPAGGQPFPATGGTTTTRACSNPNCKHCGFAGAGKPNSRR